MGTPWPGPPRPPEDTRTAAGEVAWALIPGCSGVTVEERQGPRLSEEVPLPRIPSTDP